MKNIPIIAICAFGVLVIVSFFISMKNQGSAVPEGKYDAFAACVGEKKATFYGAFWCSHCQNQKKEFGSSAHLLPYVECSTPDGNGVTAVCKEKGIKGYPTWEFADGTRETGELSLEHLAEKTSCALPS